MALGMQSDVVASSISLVCVCASSFEHRLSEISVGVCGESSNSQVRAN